MRTDQIPYRATGHFSKLVTDYLDKNQLITSFFGNLPTIEGFADQLNKKVDFNIGARMVLADRLTIQYKELYLSEEERQNIEYQINKLRSKNTFCVTTGHQLCLFTGPLYTIYKIVHTIQLAAWLSEKFEDKEILPVFWMATEDHDFEEVNHVRLFGEKLVWNAVSGNAVGRMSTVGLEDLIEKARSLLPEGETTGNLLSDLKEAYTLHTTLSGATRALIHKWFGHKGLIIVDGDDAVLKRSMIPIFRNELIHRQSAACLLETNHLLGKYYPVQVAGREINLFYLHEGKRTRIVQKNEQYQALETSVSWSESEILTELEEHPERFSPNVLLRPLYQETILPNIAYIGGGGEVAYWAQLKSVFDSFDVPFPIVMLRKSFGMLAKKMLRKTEKLNLMPVDLFKGYEEISKELIRRTYQNSISLENELENISKLFEKVSDLAETFDSTLVEHIGAQKKKSINSLKGIEEKLWRAARKKEQEQLAMLKEVIEFFLPGGGLQERQYNILEMITLFGPQIWDVLYQQTDPLNNSFTVLSQDSM